MTDNTQQKKTPRRGFSVSREFEYILDSIDNMPNMSRFICEAIAEKLERQESETVLSLEEVKRILQYAEMLGLTPQQTQQIALNKKANTSIQQNIAEMTPTNAPSPAPTQSTPATPSYQEEEDVETKNVIEDTPKETEITEPPSDELSDMSSPEKNVPSSEIPADVSENVNTTETKDTSESQEVLKRIGSNFLKK